MEMLLGRTDDCFGLIIHIGCGDSAGRFWQDRADTVILVEPDPERALAIKTWLEGGGKGTLIEAAVADRSGEGIFRRTSFGAMNSLRVPTGAKELFPGLQSLETVPVNMVRPRDLLSGRALENTRGRIGLVVDAPSEALLVLADLDDAGVLEQFDDIAVRVAERPLHEGGADRKDVEAWLKDTGRCLVWEPDPDDPDLRYAFVETDWKTRNSQNEQRVLELEEEVDAVRQSYAKASSDAQTNFTAFEKAKQDREALKEDVTALREEVDAVRRSYASASEEAQANLTALDEAQRDREALKAEVEELKTALSKTSEEAQANFAALDKAKQDREALKEDVTALREEVDAVRRSYASASEEAQANLTALDEAKQDRETLKAEVEELKTALSKTSEEAQANFAALDKVKQDREALKAEVEELKTALSKTSEEAQANFAALDKVKQDREALKAEVEELKTALSKASREVESMHKLYAELEALRDDNRLSLRIQRVAQADLADLQDRYASLAHEKLELENFLDELAEKVRQSMDSRESLSSEKNTKEARSRNKTSSKPARKRSRAQSK
jgi:chromosome segregation ATPase